MKKPRKPGPVHLNNLQRAAEASAKMHPTDREALWVIVAHSFLAFKRGEDCQANWRNCADALNIAEALSGTICSDEVSRSKIQAGHAVLIAVAGRHSELGTWTMYPAEMQALDEALFIHRVQMDFCSLGEYQCAVKRVADRTRSALAGNAGRGVQVVRA